MEEPLPGLQSFPRDDRLWRVDWFGKFALNAGCSAEPTVEVILSRLRVKDPPHRLLTLHALDIEPDSQQAVLIGVGTLPYVSIGSVWRNGELKGTPHYDTYHGQDLEFSPESLRPFSAGDRNAAPASNTFIIPPYLHRIGIDPLQTRCLGVRRDDDPYHLIIPMVELIRFYYAGSTHMARMAFAGPFATVADWIYNVAASGWQADGSCLAWLRAETPNADARIVACLSTSAHARAGFSRIYHSVQRRFIDQRAAHPETFPPFTGRAEMKARGRRFRHGGRERFLVFRIEAGNLPGPGRILRARDNDGRSDGVRDAQRPAAWAGSGRRRLAHSGWQPLEQGRVSHAVEPARLAAPVMPVLDEGRFIDPVEIRAVEKTECRYRAATPAQVFPGGELPDLSTGDGTHGKTPAAPLRFASRAGGGERKTRTWSALAAGFKEFIDILRELNGLGAEYTIIAVSERYVEHPDGPRSLFPVEDAGMALPWSYSGRDTRRVRQVLTARIAYKTGLFYALEIERRPGRTGTPWERYKLALVHDHRLEPVGHGLLERVLALCALQRGRWSWPPMLFPTLMGRTFAHTWPTALRFAQALHTYMESTVKRSMHIGQLLELPNDARPLDDQETG